MTHEKGWINRQIAQMERESKNWPEWMRREVELRYQQQQKASSIQAGTSKDEATLPPPAKTSGETQ